MKIRLLTIAIDDEKDIVPVRERTRKIAELLGFDKLEQTRITTAVSEIARNAWEYAKGGRIQYALVGDSPQELEIRVEDRGEGIADIEEILSGAYRSKTGMGLGILGARRLMDAFEIDAAPGRGTVVRMTRRLPQRSPTVGQKELARLSKVLAERQDFDPVSEIRQQSQEMLIQFEELRRHRDELLQVNQELQDTNRGVIALYAELDERADHLRRADQLKSRFLSNMSHEFRTPLNSILALSRLLLTGSDGSLGTEQERQVQFIRKGAETLTELVNDLLDLAKVAAGKTVVAPAEFEVADLFGALRGMLRPLLVGDAVSLTFEDAADVPTMITDEGKVSQILRNFVSNAIKFTERGEVRVWAEHDREKDAVIFAVRDTGVGIAPDEIEIIWQEFAQLDHPLQSRVKGTGLGLPLSKNLAVLLGGDVDVESAPGQGSVFRLTLPRLYRKGPGEPEPALDWTPEPGRLPVMLVDDDPADSFALERALVASRYQLLTVQSVAQAKRVLERMTPAAILMDLMLVGEESWRLLMEIRQQPALELIPVVVVSTLEEERKARSLGADGYLRKPVEPALLLKTLDALTGGRSVTRVLMVDDEEVSRYLVRQLLPRGIFELSEAANSLDGLRRVRAELPDIVLLDINMPSLDGFEFLARLAEDSEAKQVAAVVLTSMILTPEQQRRLDRANSILRKSDLSSETLVAALNRAAQSREVGAA